MSVSQHDFQRPFWKDGRERWILERVESFFVDPPFFLSLHRKKTRTFTRLFLLSLANNVIIPFPHRFLTERGDRFSTKHSRATTSARPLTRLRIPRVTAAAHTARVERLRCSAPRLVEPNHPEYVRTVSLRWCWPRTARTTAPTARRAATPSRLLPQSSACFEIEEGRDRLEGIVMIYDRWIGESIGLDMVARNCEEIVVHFGGWIHVLNEVDHQVSFLVEYISSDFPSTNRDMSYS